MLCRLASAVTNSKAWFEMVRASYHPLHQNIQQTSTLEHGLAKAEMSAQTLPRWLHSTNRFSWLWRLLLWFWNAVYGKITRKLPKKNSTSYLNGLRGVACIVVYTQHFSQCYFMAFNNPYGAEPANQNHEFTQLPLIRIIYAGKGMVAIFFVLSGFVLTSSPLRKITNPSAISTDELTTSLCSSILRRGIRLYTPMFIMAIVTCLATWYYPIFSSINWREGDPTFLQHIWHLVLVMKPTLDPIWFDPYPYHPPGLNHCWSIPIEFRGSMVVFLMCITTARLTTRARKIIVLGTAFWHLHFRHGDMFAFLCGMFLAELRYCPLSEDFTFLSKCKIPRPFDYTLSICVALLALLLMGWPENGDAGVEPFRTLAQFTPQIWKVNNDLHTHFWGYITAPVLLAALENLPPAQRLLSTTPILYLGEISFPFYLLHWLAFRWPGQILIEHLFYVHHFSVNSSFYIAYVLILILTIVVAACFGKPVDDRCVKLSRDFVNWIGVHGSPVNSNQLRRKDLHVQSL